MKNLIDFFLKRSLLVNLISLILIIGGSLSIYLLQKEMFPPVDFDVIVVSTAYPGSSAEDVEKLVTIEIERKLRGVDGIKEMNAMSAENRSIVYLEVDPDADLDEVESDVRDAVDLVQDLPEDVDKPIVTSADNSRRPFIKVAVRGEDLYLLRKVSKDLESLIEKIKGVSKTELGGYQPHEIRVELDQNKLNSLELTSGEVSRAIRNRNLNLSAGRVETSSKNISIRTVGEFNDIEDIKNVVVRSNRGGQQVLVEDLAKVSEVLNEEDVLQRSNGQRAIFVDVRKTPTADILKTTKAIKKVVDEYFKEENPEGIAYRYTDELAFYVKRRLGILASSGFMGMALVFLMLTFFLNIRTSIVTTFGAPIAFMAAFLVMEGMGLALNLISMFGLILVLGMLVDDAIIVAEQYFQRLEQGHKPMEAAKLAAEETIRPVIATIVTTMIAFGSLFFMGGIMGKFLWQVPAIVIICLAASLFECFLILPSHLADFSKLEDENEKKGLWGRFIQWLMTKTPLSLVGSFYRVVKHFLNVTLKGYYTRCLKVVINHYYFVIIGFFVVLLASFGVAKNMKKELFPGDDVREIYINGKGKVGSPIEVTDKNMKILENVIHKSLDSKTELKQTRTIVGIQIGGQGSRTGSHYGSIIVYLTPPDMRERSTDQISSSIMEKAKALIGDDFTLELKKIQGGPPKGKPVEIDILGGNLGELKVVSQKVRNVLGSQKGVQSAEIDFEEGNKQLSLQVNEVEAKRLGLSASQIALEVRRAFAGDSVTEIRRSDEDIEIKVMFDEVARSKVETLNDFFILNSSGNRIRLDKVAEFKETPGAFIIRRKDRKRIISVSAELDKDVTTPIEMADLMTPLVRDIVKEYPGVNFEMSGENKDTQESMLRLSKAAIIALGAIFLVLVAMFSSLGQSFVVMSAIPLGLIGVIFTFKVTGDSLGFMAMMGVVGLVGVVVNDSIVLVNFTNVRKKAILATKSSEIYRKAREKLRFFFLLSPVIFGGIGGVIYKLLGKHAAMAFGGLLFLTIIIVILMAIINDKRKKPFVTYLEDKKDEMNKLPNIVVEAGVSRFRAVILTTFTTVAGLLPIAHARAGDPFLKPMALSFAWGLLFASLVTLLFIPCCYLLHAKVADFLTGFVVKAENPELFQMNKEERSSGSGSGFSGQGNEEPVAPRTEL